MKLIHLINILFILAVTLLLTSCSDGGSSSIATRSTGGTFGRGTPGQAGNAASGNTAIGNTGGTAAADASSAAQVIKVGTMSAYFPYSLTDEDGNLTGFDVETVRLLDSKMDDVEFEFVTGALDSIFLELDSGRIQMIASQIGKNPEREEKYLFSDDGYLLTQTKLTVNSEDNTRTTLEDMAGETMGGITGDYFTGMMEDYNAANGNPFELQYYDGDYVSVFTDIAAGRIAGTLNDTTVVDGYAKSMGLDIKCVGDVIESSYVFFCIRDDEDGRDFKIKLDAALEEALADGSLAALSMDWFGDDYTKAN